MNSSSIIRLEGSSNVRRQVILLGSPESASGAGRTSTSARIPRIVGVPTTVSVPSLTNSPKTTSASSENELKIVSVVKPAIAPKRTVAPKLAIAPKPAILPKPAIAPKPAILPKPAISPKPAIPQDTVMPTAVTSTTKKKIPSDSMSLPSYHYKERSGAVWSRRAVEPLIVMFKDRPCLYDNGDPNFFSRVMKNRAAEEIAAKLAPFRPNTTAEDVKTKIKSLKQQFLTALFFKRRKKNVEVPTKCWLYDHMKFLIPHLHFDVQFKEKGDNVETDTSRDVAEAVKTIQCVDLEPEPEVVVSTNNDVPFNITDYLQIPTSSDLDSCRGDPREHSYYMEPISKCRAENSEEPSRQSVYSESAFENEMERGIVQSSSPERKRKRDNSMIEERKSKERKEGSETEDKSSVLTFFFNYLMSEALRIEDPDILSNLKTKLFNLVMENVKLDLSKRTRTF